MSDYSNSFSGANKDATNATILGADHDTQYNAIAAMSATKADKISGATNNNLVAMDANGNIKDSTIAFSSGTWTPTIQDDSRSDSESQTYSVQNGVYRRIGDIVYISADITMTSLGSLTTGQAAVMAGLPFTSAATYTHSITCGQAGGVNLGSATTVTGTIEPSDDVINLYKWNNSSSVSTLKTNEITATGILKISGFYLV